MALEPGGTACMILSFICRYVLVGVTVAQGLPVNLVRTCQS
jgi:hypothetical protein